MGLINSIFNKPRLYDNDYQIERILLPPSDEELNYTFDALANRQLIGIEVTGRTVGGIRSANCTIQFQILDGQYHLFQSSSVSLRSAQSYGIIWNTNALVASGSLPISIYISNMPTNIFITPGMTLKLWIYAHLNGDDIDFAYLTCKRWKL